MSAPSLPMTEPMPGMPDRVTIYEVGPRDGLQNEQGIVPVESKAEFTQRLLAAGLPVVEAAACGTPVICWATTFWKWCPGTASWKVTASQAWRPCCSAW